MAVQIVKPMALQQGCLGKHVRTGKATPSQYEGVEKPKGMANAPAESLLKEIIRGVQQPQVIEIVDDSPVKKGRVGVFICIVVTLSEVRL